MSEIYNHLGQVEDPDIAREMAKVEDPYHKRRFFGLLGPKKETIRKGEHEAAKQGVWEVVPKYDHKATKKDSKPFDRLPSNLTYKDLASLNLSPEDRATAIERFVSKNFDGLKVAYIKKLRTMAGGENLYDLTGRSDEFYQAVKDREVASELERQLKFKK